MFSEAAASTKLDDNHYLSDMEFYTYPLPDYWIDDTATGEVDGSRIPIFLQFAGYHWRDSNLTWKIFKQYPLKSV